MNPNPSRPDTKNLLTALALCAVLIVGWQYFVEIPKRQRLAVWQQQQLAQKKQIEVKEAAEKAQWVTKQETVEAAEIESPRIAITSPTLQGTLALKGLRFDELILTQYKETLDKDSPDVKLLMPTSSEAPYFMQLGWLSDAPDLKVPNEHSIWKTTAKELSPTSPVTLEWNNGEGVTFTTTISLDDHYMFTIKQSVKNESGRSIQVKPYGLINRSYKDVGVHAAILHEGPLGVLDGALKEISYDELKKEKQQIPNAHGWLGFTDKYWLTALIPDQNETFAANFVQYNSKGKDRYQSDYVGLEEVVSNGESLDSTLHFFAGAKKIDVLDMYTNGVEGIALKPVPLFDRSVDFGVLYFMTKPIFLTLNFFYKIIGNFGVAILLLTFVIKGLMFPLANKGYKSMSQLRALQPEIRKLQERYAEDKLKMQQELLSLYRREKVNPASGCLPLLIQMPVFFALYKVLFVTIEMRHAPFFGPWQDLSAMDPTNIFTLFGLIPWDPPHVFMLGILPIIMTATMIIQQRQQPTPADPVQAKVIKFMPWFLLFVVHRMPAGLVLYWITSNIWSIIQQQLITKKYNRTHPNKPAV